MGCENMISLTQMKFVECHIFYVQKQNQDQEEAVFNRCGHFFWDRNSLWSADLGRVSLFLLWAPVVPTI